MKINRCTYHQPILTRTAFKSNKVKPLADNFSSLDKFTQHTDLQLKTYIPIFKNFINATGKYKDTYFKDVIGRGGYSVIFDIGNNEIIKFTKENPYQYRQYIKGLDVPLLDFDEFNGFYILREAKAITEKSKLKPEHRTEIIRRMEQYRLEPSADFREHRLDQIGLIDERPYLLDTRCAVPKPNKFTEFVENFALIHRKRKFTCYRNDVNSFEIEHIDEAPRPNLSLYKGVKEILLTIADNIEYYTREAFNKQSNKFIKF